MLVATEAPTTNQSTQVKWFYADSFTNRKQNHISNKWFKAVNRAGLVTHFSVRVGLLMH